MTNSQSRDDEAFASTQMEGAPVIVRYCIGVDDKFRYVGKDVRLSDFADADAPTRNGNAPSCATRCSHTIAIALLVIPSRPFGSDQV